LEGEKFKSAAQQFKYTTPRSVVQMILVAAAKPRQRKTYHFFISLSPQAKKPNWREAEGLMAATGVGT
jgi:hypothetical protein